MSADQTTEPPRQRLDGAGFSTAYPSPEGMVSLDLWPAEKNAASDPARYSMTPGQAMELIRKLAEAAKRALRGAVA